MPHWTRFRNHALFPSLAIALALLAAAASAAPARADVAPPAYPQGANLQPGSPSTQVQMVSEQVKLSVVNLPEGNEPGRAFVSADFQMQNQGSASETMDVRFPLSVLNGFGDGRGAYPEIQDLLVWVGDTRTATTRITTPNPASASELPQAWASFSVTFPPGKTVPIRVTYTAEGIGYSPNVQFTYVLETGAGWKDAIGSADLTVHLPYPANDINVIVPECTPGMVLDGSDLRWHMENLEPQPGQNLEVGLMMTGVWQKISSLSQTVERSPNSGETWGQLGKAYKEALLMKHGLRDDAGGNEMYRRAVSAYEKAVALLPKDALWHYGFAELLWYRFFFSNYDDALAGDHPDLQALVRAIQELKASLDLQPDTPDALNLAQVIKNNVPGSIVISGGQIAYPGLTATPVVTPYPTYSPAESETPPPTPTWTLGPPPSEPPAPSQAALPPPSPEPTRGEISGQAGSETGAFEKKTGLPVCGAGLALPLLIFLGAALWPRRIG